MSLAPYIDHTLLKPQSRLSEIEVLCKEAKQHAFAAVCVPPYFVGDAARILQGSPVQVAIVIGFPFGYEHFQSKITGCRQAMAQGATELDIVMNIAAFKSNDIAWLETEINTILEVVQGQALTKLIIESGLMSDEEIVRICELYGHFALDFLKTSTGYAPQGASVEAVRLMRQHLPDRIRIKASGGIKTTEQAQAMIDAGASRIGTSSGVAIVGGEPQGHRDAAPSY